MEEKLKCASGNSGSATPKPENPAAFPRPFSADQIGDYTRDYFAQDGMTLRDYFAAAALQGILAGPCSRDGVPVSEWSDVPHQAYRLADAMLKARTTA
jgi:hypothetical protein